MCQKNETEKWREPQVYRGKKVSLNVTVDRVSLLADGVRSSLQCWLRNLLLCNAKRSRLLCRKNCQPISCDNNPRVSELNNIFAATGSGYRLRGLSAGHRNFYLIYVWRWEIRASLSIRREWAAVALGDFAIIVSSCSQKSSFLGKSEYIISIFLKINKMS